MDVPKEIDKRIIWIKYKCPRCSRTFKRILKHTVYTKVPILCAYDKNEMLQIEEKRET